MNWFPTRVSDDDSSSDSASSRAGARPRDSEILDAYSTAVIGVVDAVSPAVISISGRGAESNLGAGSGFVVTADGFAVTNSHVVAGRKDLIAETNEGDRVDAKVVGDDPATDIALLQLTASDLPHVTIGDSESLRVGQLVIAMGSPLGLQSTVSTGIVSATGRSMRSQAGRMIESVIQHSAPINPGNSGGPLLDSRGNVVGINTAVIEMAQGIGFAVPSNTAQWVTTEIVAHGTVRRRHLGIAATGIRLSRSAIREFDLFSDQAVAVRDVLPQTVAAKAGLRAGDVIVAMNGRIVESIDDLHRLLSLFPMDAQVELTIVRDSQRIDVQLAGGE